MQNSFYHSDPPGGWNPTPHSSRRLHHLGGIVSSFAENNEKNSDFYPVLWIRNDVFWIRIQPMFFKQIFKLLKKHFNIQQKEESTNYLPFSISLYSPTVLQSRINGLKLKLNLSALSFLPDPEQTILDQGKSSGRIRLDPDPQHCFITSLVQILCTAQNILFLQNKKSLKKLALQSHMSTLPVQDSGAGGVIALLARRLVA